MGTASLPAEAGRLDRLDHAFVDHDLKAAALWANALAQLRGRRDCTWLWLGERELRAKRMRARSPQGDHWLPFLPDAYFEVVYPATFEALEPTAFESAEWVDLNGRNISGVLYGVASDNSRHS